MRASEFCSLGGGFGMRMGLTEGKMAKDDPQLSGEALPHCIDDRMCEPAVRAFVVAVFDQRDRSVDRSPNVIMLRDWNFERGHDHSSSLFGMFSSASRMPSAPGLTAIGEQ